MSELDAAIKRILKFPEAWGRISKDFRHCNFRRFPYTVIYSIETGSDILIVSVFHQHREPLTWKRNLNETEQDGADNSTLGRALNRKAGLLRKPRVLSDMATAAIFRP
ncbi:MAG: type II toxin-antitoxin system RelE/ParE family toxin, partial [Verrucomicrobiota bacterium]